MSVVVVVEVVVTVDAHKLCQMTEHASFSVTLLL